jgi:diacylglycerol kinase family enzyme
VIALGGDGTVNEIVNGLLTQGPSLDMPALAVVPGGSTNVFARALGYSPSPVEATGELLEALREGRTRRVSLGMAHYGQTSRWFTFCAGMGIDADVVARVERGRAKGRRNTPGLYLRSAASEFARGAGRSASRLRLSTPASTAADTTSGGTDADAAAPTEVDVAIVCNTTPWTYLDRRPVRACPQASFNTGLDLFGLRRLRLTSALRTGRQMLFGDKGPHGRNVVSLDDEAEIGVVAGNPVSLQLDGEYLGKHETVRMTSALRAIRVVA